MKWYFAAGSSTDVRLLMEEGVQDILLSFAHCPAKGLPESAVEFAQKKGTNLMVDSGAFTNKNKPGTVTMEGYLEFLKEFGPLVTEFVGLDDISHRPTTLKNYRKMLDAGFKNTIMVDHLHYPPNSPLRKVYSTGKKMGWGGLVVGNQKDKSSWEGSQPLEVRIAERAEIAREGKKTVLHLFGVGQKLRKFMPWLDIVDSFDSSTWITSVGKYGRVPYYVPAGQEAPYPKFRQLDPNNKLPSDLAARVRASKLDLTVSKERAKLCIRELLKFYRAVETYYVNNKSKGEEFLLETCKQMDADALEDEHWEPPSPPVFVQWGRNWDNIDLEKIKDVDDYEAYGQKDDVLRDDFRIALAWYATAARDAGGISHSKEQILAVLTKIVRELVRRGKTTFSPNTMKPAAREAFEVVGRRINIPDEVVKKELELPLTPDIKVGELASPELRIAHDRVHFRFRAKVGGLKTPGWSVEDYVNVHTLLVQEMARRKVSHPEPPKPPAEKDDLDDRTDRLTGDDKPTKKLLPVEPSGNDLGEPLYLDETLKRLDGDVILRDAYVSIVGGIVCNGETRGDVDILVKQADWAGDPTLRKAMEFRIMRALGSEYTDRVQFIYDDLAGPITDHVHLYRLRLERVPGDVIKRMALVTKEETAEAASATLRREGEAAARQDKVIPGKFFFQPKPTKPVDGDRAEQSIETLVKLASRKEAEWPWLIQKKWDGARHQIHKRGDQVRIISEDQGDNTGNLPSIVKAVRALKADTLVITGEIEAWDGPQHLPREAVKAILGRNKVDDSQVVFTAYNVLYCDAPGEKHGDVHGWPEEKRLALLDKLGIPQKEGVPTPGLNRVTTHKATNPAAFERIVRKLRTLPGSEGVVAKQAGAAYPLDGTTVADWLKFHNTVVFTAKVIGQEKAGDGAYTYEYGLKPDGVKPHEKLVAGVVPTGKTFNSSVDIKPGERIRIEAEGFNIERHPGDAVRPAAWAPRVLGKSTEMIDSVKDVERRAKSNRVLQVKDVDEKGNATYLTQKYIHKAADPFMTLPPEGPKYPFVVQTHWRGKSMHNDLRIAVKPGKELIGWTLNTQMPDAVKKPVESLDDARAMAKRDDVSKIDWATGKWAEREKRGADKPVRTEILSERKAPEPWAWLKVEGVTDVGEVGGTANHPGVFLIVDKGEAEYGAQKSWFHEYHMASGKLKGRLIFRQLRLGKMQAMVESAKGIPAAIVATYYAAGAPSSWPPALHRIASENPLTADLEYVLVKGLAAHHGLDPTTINKDVLPPSQAQERALDGSSWLAIKPDDQTPYVLSPEAVEKGWMPPAGFSALPADIREDVPPELRYWKKTGDAAKKLRDKLVETAKKGGVDFTLRAATIKGLASNKAIAVRILKAEKEKRLITGAVLVPEQRDAQGDIYSHEVVEEAAFDFLARYGSQSKLGLNHEKFGMIGTELVESWISRQGEEVGGTTPKEGTWLMTVRAKDARIWEDFKRGVYTGFSIGGKARVQQ